MSTITAQDQASTTTTAAERGRARAMEYLTNPATVPAGYRRLTEAEATDPDARQHLDLALLAGVGLVVKLPEPTEAPADLVADLEATADPTELLAETMHQALTAAREAGVATGRYTSGASSRDQLDQAHAYADQAAQAMWRAFYSHASR